MGKISDNPAPMIKTFKVTIDYSQSLADMVSAGKYDHTDYDIMTEKFPVVGEGTIERELAVVHFGRYMDSSESVIAELAQQGYRPATIEELLALGAQHSALQWRWAIIALGSVRWDPVRGRGAPCLLSVASDRFLVFGRNWDDDFRFLAVRT